MTKVKNHLLVSFVTKNPMLFNHILCAKLIIQITHLCGFLPSWTFAICLFKSTLNAKLDSQMLHLCALFFKSTLCFFNELFAVKLISQIVHICGFWPSCTVAICWFNELLIYWKCSITKSTFFFFLSWTNATCIFKSMAHERIMALVRITQVKTHLLVSFVPKKSNATYLNWHFMSSGAI